MQPFVIPLNGLAQGRTEFRWEADGEFFSSFENSEILDAELDIEVIAEKSGRFIGLDITIDGSVTVECDRCLGDLEIPVLTENSFSVKFGEASDSGFTSKSGEREILFVPEDNTDLDLSQVVYDYTCLSLPMMRVHEDGDCDPETLKYLSSEQDSDGNKCEEEIPADNPFAALKDLLKNK